MAIAKLNLVSLDFDKDNCNDVLLELYQRDDFHPELASKFTDSVAGLSAYNNDNLYEELLSRIEEMKTKYHFEVPEVETDSQLNVFRAKEFLDDLFLDIDRIDAVKKELTKMIEENEEAIITLNHVEGSNIDFDQLFGTQYLKIRFGKLPLNNEGKLEYYETLPFVYKAFQRDDKYVWCMYMTTPTDAPEVDNVFTSLYFEKIHIPEFVHGSCELAGSCKHEVDNVFTSLYFEKIHIPEFVHGSCELAEKEIQNESDSAKQYSQGLQNRIDKTISENMEELTRIYSVAKKLNSVYAMQKYIVKLGDKLNVHGFVPKNDLDNFKNTFESIDGVKLEVLPATSDVRLEPPTRLKNSWFARPFRMFVEMYGVPRYNDVDPTLLVAISYTLLFGIMFGDLGQGIILSLVGLVAEKKFNLKLGGVGVRLGISSAIFGVFFGSFFGNEEILSVLIL